ncbi:MAG: SDR family NAD(P)-dependent oxidoreductase [Pseudonocardiaceae bacterium]
MSGSRQTIRYPAARIVRMELNFTNRTAVVTGGSKGIGLALCGALVAEGAKVVVGSRGDSGGLASLRERGDVTAVSVDLATPTGPAELIRTAVDAHGGIDILVNNVGASEAAAASTDFDDEQWQRVFDVTFFSAVRAVRSALPAMKGREDACIVNVSSLNTRLPQGAIAPYCAAKAALTNLSKAWAEELGPQGIRVNTVSPGPVRTPFWTEPGAFADFLAAKAGTDAQDFMDRVLPEQLSVTTGRVSEAEEVADLVMFLASDRARNISGADYIIDGGMFKAVA